jgi:hypothetical protein
MRRSWTPSIVPSGHDQTVYLVINNFGNLGSAFAETDVDKADLETIIGDLMSGQYGAPVRVVAFNTAEQWSADVSQDVAHEIRRRADLAGDDLAPSIAEFRRDASRSYASTFVAIDLGGMGSQVFRSDRVAQRQKADHLTRCCGIHH